MKCLIIDEVFDVWFKTSSSKALYGDVSRDLRSITCFISRKNDISGESMSVSEGTAKQHYVDKFDGVVGRKKAFTRALISFNKEDRTKFWEMYKRAVRIQHSSKTRKELDSLRKLVEELEEKLVEAQMV